MSASLTATLRHDWSLAEVKALFVQPFNDLLFQAQTVHRAHFDANRVPCCRSKPAPARKIANIVRSRATTTRAWKKKN